MTGTEFERSAPWPDCWSVSVGNDGTVRIEQYSEQITVERGSAFYAAIKEMVGFVEERQPTEGKT